MKVGVQNRIAWRSMVIDPSKSKKRKILAAFRRTRLSCKKRCGLRCLRCCNRAGDVDTETVYPGVYCCTRLHLEWSEMEFHVREAGAAAISYHK